MVDDVVEEGGFEPPKQLATDLQSAPFGHSGTPPYLNWIRRIGKLRPAKADGAGGRIRTPDLLITNQLLYRLSYTSASSARFILAKIVTFVNTFFNSAL